MKSLLPRFTLRRLAGLLIAMNVCMALGGYLYRRGSEQQRRVETLNMRGVGFGYAPNVLTHLRLGKVFGHNYVASVHEAQLADFSSPFEDALDGLTQLKHLEKLEIVSSHLNDAQVASIGRIKSLRLLNFNTTPITDDRLLLLRDLTNLELLQIYGDEGQLTESGFQKLRQILPRLRIAALLRTQSRGLPRHFEILSPSSRPHAEYEWPIWNSVSGR